MAGLLAELCQTCCGIIGRKREKKRKRGQIYFCYIVQRGHNRQVVFVCDEDYQYYLENLKYRRLG